jgi:hypothetical protein
MLLAALSAAIVLPFTAYPLTSSTVRDPQVQRCFSELVDAGGRGRRSDERAAFLVYDAGTFSCVAWPSRFGYNRAEWNGRIPDGAIAVVHTHPLATPLPSWHDLKEAARIGAPVVVVTPDLVSAAMPRGEVITLAGAGWQDAPAQNVSAAKVVDMLRNDATRTDPPPHARQARALSDQGPGAHPAPAPR